MTHPFEPPDAPPPPPGTLTNTAFHAAVLQGVPLFSGLGEAHLQALAASMRAQVFEPGELIITQGGSSGALYVLQAGHALMVRTDPQGREFILGDVRTGDHFGEMSLVDGQPHSASVVARLRCRVLMLGETEFARCLASDKGFCVEVLLGLTRRMRQATSTIGGLALMDVRSRVVHKLQELSEVMDGQRVIRGRLSRTELAKRVGASREMVSRLLSEMQAQGLLGVTAEGDIVLKLAPDDDGDRPLPGGEWPPTAPGGEP